MLCQSLLYSQVTQLYTYRLSLFMYNFAYLFLAMLGLHCCVGIFSSCKEQGLLSRVVPGLFTVVTTLVTEHGL